MNYSQEERDAIHMRKIVALGVSAPLEVIGLVTNTLLIIFMVRPARRTAIYRIIQVLAVTDLICLLFHLTFSTTRHAAYFFPFLLDAVTVLQSILPLAAPIYLVLGMANAWLTALISLERWLAVCRPLSVKRALTMRKTLTAIAIILLLSVLFNMPRFFENLRVQCSKQTASNVSGAASASAAVFCWQTSQFAKSYSYKYVYCVFLNAVFQLVVPVTVMIWTNFHIVSKLRQASRKFGGKQESLRRERRTTYVPLAIAVLFTVTVSPSVVLHIADAFLNFQTNPLWGPYLECSNVLVLLNLSANFLVYCLCGQRFRKQIRKSVRSLFSEKEVSESIPSTFV